MSIPSKGPVTIQISVDEWREILDWMNESVGWSEQSPHGHFLLECEGTKRTWVATDNALMTVTHGEGPPPHGLPNPNERFSVLVNSRFFRRGHPQDVTLTLISHEEGRLQAFVTDGVEVVLPEHPGEFGDWRTMVESVASPSLEVDAALLRNACRSASIVPAGIDVTTPTTTWVSICDGKLRLETRWRDNPATKVEVQLVRSSADTVPALVDTGRLLGLLSAGDFDSCTLHLPETPKLPIGLRAGRYEGVLMPIDEWGQQRRRLQELLCQFLGVDSVEADADGDYAVTTEEGHHLWVRLHTDSSPISAQVFSVLATSVVADPGLFEELNSINASAAHVKVLWAGGALMAEVDLVAEDLDLAELGNALRVVRRTTAQYVDVLSAYYTTPSGEEGHEL